MLERVSFDFVFLIVGAKFENLDAVQGAPCSFMFIVAIKTYCYLSCLSLLTISAISLKYWQNLSMNFALSAGKTAWQKWNYVISWRDLVASKISKKVVNDQLTMIKSNLAPNSCLEVTVAAIGERNDGPASKPGVVCTNGETSARIVKLGWNIVKRFSFCSNDSIQISNVRLYPVFIFVFIVFAKDWFGDIRRH